jgi:hypothetical protein
MFLQTWDCPTPRNCYGRQNSLSGVAIIREGGHNEVGIDLVIQKIRSLVPLSKP